MEKKIAMFLHPDYCHDTSKGRSAVFLLSSKNSEMKLNSYRRPLGERGSVLLVEEVEQLVLLVQGHHLTHGLIVLLFLLQSLTHNWIWKKKKKMQQETGC